MVYLASTPSAALLEACVHTSANDLPINFTLLKVVGPEVRFGKVEVTILPGEWVSRVEITRRIGMEWLRRREAVLLEIPSAIGPETTNFLFNPLHREAVEFHIEQAYPYPFDMRLES